MNPFIVAETLVNLSLQALEVRIGRLTQKTLSWLLPNRNRKRAVTEYKGSIVVVIV